MLCLAGGGGQQGPILAATGAYVTVFDSGPGQLAQDRRLADREGLTIETIQGEMADLSGLPEARFDVIFRHGSDALVSDLRPNWREALGVFRPGGGFRAGFTNPVAYRFDFFALEGELRVAHRIPCSGLTGLSEEERGRFAERDEPPAFGQTLGDQFGGQVAAGLDLAGFYGDIDPRSLLGRHITSYIATRSVRPRA